MGGDGHDNGHGHGHAKKFPYSVPDFKTFVVDERTPVLVKLRDQLAKEGLKDPWIRNEVWRFRVDWWGTTRRRVYETFFRGTGTGLVATIIVLGIQKYFFSDDEHEHKELKHYKDY